MDILTVKPIVLKALQVHPHLRDSDEQLLVHVWRQQSKKLCKHNTFTFFGVLLITRQISTPESIRRCRQRLQELTPELRGEKWAERHREEEHVQNQLKLF